MALTYHKYQIGATIPSPVYVDSNVWVSYFIDARPKHIASSTALGDLLIQCEIIISTVVFSEIWWAVLEHIYNQIRQSQDPRAPLERLSLTILKKNSHWLLPRAKPKLKEVTEIITSFTSVRIVPTETKPMNFVPDVMTTHKLAPSDALHLSLASMFGKSFFTENKEDFEGLSDQELSLAIYLV